MRSTCNTRIFQRNTYEFYKVFIGNETHNYRNEIFLYFHKYSFNEYEKYEVETVIDERNGSTKCCDIFSMQLTENSNLIIWFSFEMVFQPIISIIIICNIKIFQNSNEFIVREKVLELKKINYD